MRLNKHRNAVLALSVVAALTTIGRTAEAQFGGLRPSFYGSAEWDTRHSQFYLIGMYVGMGGLGWSPYFNINAYTLRYRNRPVDTSPTIRLSAVSPTIGLAYAGRNGGVSFGVGYTWVDNEDPGAPGAEGGGSNGVTASFGAYHNGSGRRSLHTQFLSNYNFGSEYLWARARGSVPLGYSVSHPARLGLELVGQGGGKDGRESNSFAIGPFLEYSWTRNFRTTAVVGYKSVGGPNVDRESAGYLKLEFSFSP
jgi:hypothetical protein